MIDKKTLKILVDELDLQMKDLENIDFSIFKNIKSIFIIKTAHINQFKKLVNIIKRENEYIKFYVMARSNEVQEVLKVCGDNCEIIEYKHNQNYSIDNMTDEVDLIKSKNIDRCLILFNTKYGFGYTNIEEIIFAVNDKDVLVYNFEDNLFKIKNPKLHIQSQKTYISVCEWFWEMLNVLEVGKFE